MKKTFKMTHEKIKVPRLVEAIKHEVKKYLQRERRKPLPPEVDFWDFDCRFGVDEASSEVIHVADINKAISKAEKQQLESFYLEILAKPGYRSKKTE
jgi:phosphoenolpyruvate synthase/pyruvate phosphate dikinase